MLSANSLTTGAAPAIKDDERIGYVADVAYTFDLEYHKLGQPLSILVSPFQPLESSVYDL